MSGSSGGSGTPGGPEGPGWETPRVFCFACGERIDARAEICPRCGVRQGPRPGAGGSPLVTDPDAPSRVVAGILAILLGGLGVHRFYLGDIGLGILYALFSWTSIPSVIGFIEGILYLAKSDEVFAREHPAGRGGPRSIAIGCSILVAISIALAVGVLILVTLFAVTIPEGPAGSI